MWWGNVFSSDPFYPFDQTNYNQSSDNLRQSLLEHFKYDFHDIDTEEEENYKDDAEDDILTEVIEEDDNENGTDEDGGNKVEINDIDNNDKEETNDIILNLELIFFENHLDTLIIEDDISCGNNNNILTNNINDTNDINFLFILMILFMN